MKKIYDHAMVNTSVRVDEKKLKEAKQKDIDCNEIFRTALDKELLKTSRKCPTCGKEKK